MGIMGYRVGLWNRMRGMWSWKESPVTFDFSDGLTNRAAASTKLRACPTSTGS